jgi:hypothetical protein
MKALFEYSGIDHWNRRGDVWPIAENPDHFVGELFEKRGG